MANTQIVSIGEKGQIVVPKAYRTEMKMQKGTKLLLSREKDRLILRPLNMDEDYLWMLAGESSLAEVWDNPYDERWDNVL